MKPVGFAVLLIALNMIGTSGALACRIPPRPTALRDVPADAIVLAQITAVEVSGRSWSAAAAWRGILMGSATQREIGFASQPYFTCGQMGPPKLGRYWVLYLERSENGFRVRQGFPFWWARLSGDARLARLNTLMPLGAARDATPDEARLLEMAEARVEMPAGESDLSRYTRVYARASASIVTGRLLRSRTPRRLMVDSSEELPTEDSCGCTLVHVTVDLDDLWAAGRLPPLNP